MKSAIGTMHRFGAQCARLRTLMTAFCRSRRGNVAVITGLAAIPLCAIDYSYASMIKTKLQAAADNARHRLQQFAIAGLSISIGWWLGF